MGHWDEVKSVMHCKARPNPQRQGCVEFQPLFNVLKAKGRSVRPVPHQLAFAEPGRDAAGFLIRASCPCAEVENVLASVHGKGVQLGNEVRSGAPLDRRALAAARGTES